MNVELAPPEHACPVLNKYSLDSVSSKNLLRDIMPHPGLIPPTFFCRSRLNQITSHQPFVTDMRLRSQLFYVFLAVLLVVASIVEASKKRKKDGGGKRGKRQKLLAPSTIPIDTLRSNEGRRSNRPAFRSRPKSLFRRREIQDLIALTRTLAGARDTPALGALLRGPLVGLREAEVLEIAERFRPIPSGLTACPSSTCGPTWSRSFTHWPATCSAG